MVGGPRLWFNGGGHANRSIYPTLRYAPINLVAVCNRHGEDDLEDTARNFGAERAYTDYNEMFEKEDLDAAFVVTAFKSHPQIATHATMAGLHVFVEKPPGYSLSAAKVMVRVSQETGKYLMIAFKKRFVPAYLKAKEIIQTPEFDIDMREGGGECSERFFKAAHIIGIVKEIYFNCLT